MWNAEGDQYGSDHRSVPAWTNEWAPPPYRPRSPAFKEARPPKRSCCRSLLCECVTMCVGCIASFARCILILINTVLAMIGMGFIVVGTILRFSKSLSSSLINLLASSTTLVSKMTGFDMDSLARILGTAAKYIDETTTILIVFGVAILIISIVGLCGATQRSQCLLRIYILFIATIALVITVLTIVIHYKKGPVRQASKNFLTSKFTTIYGNDTLFTHTFDGFMEIFECCGIANGTDFLRLNNTQWKTTLHQVVPESCCIRKQNVFEKCTEKPTTKNSYKDIGCFQKFWSAVQRYSKKIVIGLACTVLVLSTIIFLTCFIIKNETYKARKENN